MAADGIGSAKMAHSNPRYTKRDGSTKIVRRDSQIMDKAVSKTELLNEVSHVTLELYQLQDKIAQLQEVFQELEDRIAEVRGCIFPCSYILLRDLLEDASELAERFRDTWYGSTDTASSRPTSTMGRLLANCKTFASNRQALTRLETIQASLRDYSKKDLKAELERRKAQLAQQKLVFKQLGDLLQELERLHVESKRYFVCNRYRLIKRGVSNALYAYHHVPGLSAPESGSNSSDSSTQGRSNERRQR